MYYLLKTKKADNSKKVLLHSADIEELKTLESELKTKQNFTFSSLSISDDETDEAIIKYKSNLK